MFRQRKAFTLIELLVVIAIISLLVSILLPSLQKARDLAKRTVCMTNVHSVAVAMNMYAQEYSGDLPPNVGLSQGAMRSDQNGGLIYGPPLLAMLKLIEPAALFSPDDPYKDEESPYYSGHTNLEAFSFLPSSHPGPTGGNVGMRFSYTFREPSISFQQSRPSYAGYYEPYNLDSIGIASIVSDRFTHNFVWSFHGGTEGIYGYGGGDGWHVGYVDGHAEWKVNDPDVYVSGGEAAYGWTSRDKNWTYWDTH